jgi:hypothetical protein
VSPGTRLLARLQKATKRPSAEIPGAKQSSTAWIPAESTLARSVVPLWRSRTKTSWCPFVSPDTRFEARLSNVT